MRFALLFLCFVFLSDANAGSLKDKMKCEINDPCSDSCIYAKNKTTSVIFNPYESEPLIAINGEVHKLKKESEIYELKKLNRDDSLTLPGDSSTEIFSAKDIKVEFIKNITATSCAYQDEQGKYKSEEKCCVTDSAVTLTITTKGKSQKFKTLWDEGC